MPTVNLQANLAQVRHNGQNLPLSQIYAVNWLRNGAVIHQTLGPFASYVVNYSDASAPSGVDVTYSFYVTTTDNVDGDIAPAVTPILGTPFGRRSASGSLTATVPPG